MAAKEQQESNKLAKGKRVYLSFNEKQLQLIDTLVGEIGNDRADVVKTIFLTWLSEKGITPSLIKKRMELP
jgi:hypothetical protein